MKHKNLEPYNNRLFKTAVDGVNHYEVITMENDGYNDRKNQVLTISSGISQPRTEVLQDVVV